MYIWIGCKLPESYEHEIRKLCLAQNEKIGLNTDAFSLPQHISLKISFQIDDHCAGKVLDYLTGFLSAQPAFEVRILHPEQFGAILWLTTEKNETLQRLHEALDRELEQRFGIPQHEFDKCFLFHSTLFMDEDTDRIAQMLDELKDIPFERTLHINTFLLGISPDGIPDVIQEIKV